MYRKPLFFELSNRHMMVINLNVADAAAIHNVDSVEEKSDISAVLSAENRQAGKTLVFFM